METGLMSGNPRRTGLITMACLAIHAILLSDSRAETAIGEARISTASSEITCARYGSARVPHAARTTSHRTHASSLVGKAAADIPIWRTISLGTQENADALRETLVTARCAVGNLAGQILDQPTFVTSESKTDIDLAVLSAADLGVETESAPLSEIYRRAAQLGYDLCPAEVGPQLRLQYPDQPLGEFLLIAMEPIMTPQEDVAAFIVGNGGAGLILIGNSAPPDLIVPSMVRFVFLRPR